MKVRTKRNIPQANKIFTDREEPRASFWKNYASCKQRMEAGDGEIKVLTYYGIGGIGKSTLLKKLQEEMMEKVAKPKYVYFDFNIAQDSRTVLEYLKNKLANDYKFKFPLFELGVYAYAQKIGEDVSAPQVQGFIAKSPLLSFAAEYFGNIPMVDIGVQLIRIADAGYTYAKYLTEKHKYEINDIEIKLPGELHDYLPYLFAKDLADNLENAREPLVVFFDTYEQLVNEMSSVGESLNNDLWIRGEDGLVQNIPNVLWVLAGREKLKWEHFNADWQESLEQHILGTLSLVDSDYFLRMAGIANAKLRHDLYILTNGTPVYLDLCVDRYNSLLEKGETPKIEDFGQNVYGLIERFARYMDDNRKDIVYMLSCLKFWNDYMITDIGPKVIPGFSLTTYDKVKDFSFVNKSDTENYNIHQTVGEVWFNNCPGIIKKAVAKHAVEYCVNKLNNTSPFDSFYAYHLQWLVKFGLTNYRNAEDLLKYCKEHISCYVNTLAEFGQAPLAEFIFTPIMTIANNGDDSELQALALLVKSNIKVSKGEYTQSTALAEKSVELYCNILGEKHPNTIEAMNCLSNSYSKIGDYEKALAVGEQVVELFKEVLGNKNPATLRAMNNLSIEYSEVGEAKAALFLAEKVVELFKEVLGEKHPDTITAMDNLAIRYSQVGRTEDAFRIGEEVLNLEKEVLGEKHPHTIDAIHNQIVRFGELGRYSDALELCEEVVELSKEVYGEKHPNTISAMNNLSACYSGLGRYEEALQLNEEVLKTRKEMLGEKHPDTINSTYNMFIFNEGLGKHEQVLEIGEKVLKLFQEVFGEMHPKTMDFMGMLINKYKSLERYENAMQLKKEMIGIYREIFGEFHPETLEEMYNLFEMYQEIGKYEEALQLRTEMFEVCKEMRGEKHLDTLQAKYDIAVIYSETGRCLEALPMVEEVYVSLCETLGEDDEITEMVKGTLDGIKEKLN